MNEPRPTAHPPQAPHAPHAPQPARPAIIAPPASARPSITPMPTMKAPPSLDDLEPIALVEEEEPMVMATPVAAPHPTTNHHPHPQSQSQPHAQSHPPPPAPKKIIAFGADAHRHHHDWKRVPVKTGSGACRVRSFHGKYSEQGLEYLDNAINEWLDGHPEVEVKFVTSTVMTFEGKIREPALVLNIWY